MISNIDIALRLALSAGLGSLIGFERERLLWAAGIRTHMLVAVGSCLLMIVSAYGFQHALLMDHVVLDPSRIAAQVVTGIGFLGAGSILLRGHVVRGLTTAASIWTVAAIGLAAGGGLYFAAGLSTVIILLILVGVKPLEDAYRARVQSCTIRIVADRGTITPDNVKHLLSVRGGQIKRFLAVEVGDPALEEVTVYLVRVSSSDIRTAETRLKNEASVVRSEIISKTKTSSEA
jgi:putative Mg2+ transporter-C (MgtC) family protein